MHRAGNVSRYPVVFANVNHVITSNGFSNGTRNYVKESQTSWKIKSRVNLGRVGCRTAINDDVFKFDLTNCAA